MIKSYEEKHENQVLDMLNSYRMNWVESALKMVMDFEDKKVIGIGS